MCNAQGNRCKEVLGYLLQAPKLLGQKECKALEHIAEPPPATGRAQPTHGNTQDGGGHLALSSEWSKFSGDRRTTLPSALLSWVAPTVSVLQHKGVL